MRKACYNHHLLPPAPTGSGLLKLNCLTIGGASCIGHTSNGHTSNSQHAHRQQAPGKREGI